MSSSSNDWLLDQLPGLAQKARGHVLWIRPVAPAPSRPTGWYVYRGCLWQRRDYLEAWAFSASKRHTWQYIGPDDKDTRTPACVQEVVMRAIGTAAITGAIPVDGVPWEIHLIASHVARRTALKAFWDAVV